MWKGFFHLLKKDFRLMLSGRFFFLTLVSLFLYSCYIHFVYANIDQEIYPVCLYDPKGRQEAVSDYVIHADTREALEAACTDRYTVGIDLSSEKPELYMVTSGTDTVDYCRTLWAMTALSGNTDNHAEVTGTNSREQKNRREITAEFLFFELSAIGFLGLASMLFKEKQMGVIRIHGILPVSGTMFLFSKLILLLVSDLVFALLLTLLNIDLQNAIRILPAVLMQTGILSLIMTLTGFFCAVRLPDFRQFSLLYLVLAIFITTPVFLAGQTGVSIKWLVYHPGYHLFMAMKQAYFASPVTELPYYLSCAAATGLLFLLAHWTLAREMAKEG